MSGNPRLVVPEGWDFLVCPACFDVLPIPPDQTDAERADQVAAHELLCTGEAPPLPRALPPDIGECSSSWMPDGGHCPCWRSGRGPCCECNWPARDT